MALTIYELASPHVTTLAKLAIGTATAEVLSPTSPNAFAATTTHVDFGDFSNGIASIFADGNRNRGAFDRRINRTRQTRLKINPTLSLCPTAAEWALYLPWIFGQAGTGSGTLTYKLANNVGNQTHERNLQYSDGNGNIESYEAVAVTEAVITAGGGEGLVTLDLTTSGRNYYTNVAFPTLTNLDNTTQPFVLPDANLINGAGAGVILNSVQTLASDFRVTITNVINVDRVFNSLTQTRNVKIDRNVRVSLTYPDGGFPSLYLGGEAGIPTTIGMINGSYEMYLNMLMVRYARTPKRIVVRGEVMHTIDGEAFGTGSLTQPADDSIIALLKAA